MNGKKKGKDKSAKVKSATAATNAKEVEAVTTEAGNIHHSVTKLPANNQGLKSTEDVAEKSSHSQEYLMTDEETDKLFNAMEDFVTSYIKVFGKVTSGSRENSSAKNLVRTYSILDRLPHLSKYFKFNFREFFKTPLSLIISNEKNVDRLWNIFYSSCIVPETISSSKTDYLMKTLQVVMDTKIPKEAEGSSFVDNTPKPTCLPLESPKKKECKNEENGFSGDIREKPQSLYKTELECHDETASKNRDGMKGKARIGQEMKHNNRKADICARQTKLSGISKQGVRRNLTKYPDLMLSGSDTDLVIYRKFQPPLNTIKGTKDTSFEGKGMKTDVEAFEDIKASKAESDKTNNLIMQLQKVKNFETLEDIKASKAEEKTNDLIMQSQKEENSETLEDIKASKAEADKTNDLIIQLQKVEELKKVKDSETLEDIKASKAEADKTNDLIKQFQKTEELKKVKDSEPLGDIKASKSEAGNTNDLIMFFQIVKDYEKEKNDVTSSKKEEELLKDSIIELQNLERKIDADELEDEEASEVEGKLKYLMMQLAKIEVFEKQNYVKELYYKSDNLFMKINEFEKRKEKERGKKDFKRSSEGIQDSSFNKGMISKKQELKYDTRKNDMDKTIYPEKTKILPAGEFNPHREGKISELKCRSYDKRSLSLGTEPIATAAKTKSHEITEETTGIKYDDLQNVVAPAASFEPKEEILDLKRTEDILFVFDTDNTMKILVGGKDYQLKDNEYITFNCEEENVTISFTGKQISVLTPSSEFDISIRKSAPADSTDKATETDDLIL